MTPSFSGVDGSLYNGKHGIICYHLLLKEACFSGAF
jgi:hypothetical protein